MHVLYSDFRFDRKDVRESVLNHSRTNISIGARFPDRANGHSKNLISPHKKVRDVVGADMFPEIGAAIRWEWVVGGKCAARQTQAELQFRPRESMAMILLNPSLNRRGARALSADLPAVFQSSFRRFSRVQVYVPLALA